MYTKKKKPTIYLILNYCMLLVIFSLYMYSCNNQENNDTVPGNGLNEHIGIFTISGEVEGQKQGDAAVVFSEMMGTQTINISIHDGRDGNQTFSLNFYQSGTTVSLPDPGEYSIGRTNNPDTDFWMVYTDVENGNEYGLEATGTIIIEETTQSHLRGRFAFEAENIDFDNDGTIAVEDGVFLARIVED
jgi:hypothetical protein